MKQEQLNSVELAVVPILPVLYQMIQPNFESDDDPTYYVDAEALKVDQTLSLHAW